MDLLETFLAADRLLQHVIAGIGDAHWATTPPATFASDPDGRSVRDAVRHIARDEAWVPALLAGRTMADVGVDAFDGDLLGTDPSAAYDGLATAARAAAVRTVGPGDLERTVHCSFGDCSTEEYLWQLVVARTLGAETLAAATGAPAPVTEELAAAVLAGLAPRAELWRAVGILLPERAAPVGASARERLRALAGLAVGSDVVAT